MFISNLLQPWHLLLLPAIILPPFWMIFKKAGFPPWLSLLLFVPLINLVTIWAVGFSTWKRGSQPS
jgi:hypothetical protein